MNTREYRRNRIKFVVTLSLWLVLLAVNAANALLFSGSERVLWLSVSAFWFSLGIRNVLHDSQKMKGSIPTSGCTLNGVGVG